MRAWLARWWGEEGTRGRRGWAAVALLLLLGGLWPVLVRRVSPQLACQAAWHRSPPRRPTTAPLVPPGGEASCSDGTAWIASGCALVSRQASEGDDPWGRPWMYRVIPTEQDEQWVHLMRHYDDEVAKQRQPAATYRQARDQWARLAGGLALHPYSRGPDGVDQQGAGDDLPMKPLLGAWRSLQDVATYGGGWLLAASGLLAWGLLCWRLTRGPRSTLREALACAVFLVVPGAVVLVACLENAWTLRRDPLVREWSERWFVPPELALASSLVLVAYLALLAWRLRRMRMAEVAEAVGREASAS